MTDTRAIAQVLTIAASDSGGGAGIQGDIKAIEANGAFALSVVAAVTAQNTRTIGLIHPLPVEAIAAQLDAVFDDFEVGAVKTGMLYSADIVRVVADRLRKRAPRWLVVDPVMASSGGTRLLQPDAQTVLSGELIPLAAVVTPNVPEAEVLSGMRIASVDDARGAAAKIRQLGCRAVLITGGHLSRAPATDVLYDGESWTVIPGEWVETPHTHGTGCIYSAALAVHLAAGADMVAAAQRAKHFVTQAIRHGLAIGHGRGPTRASYRMDQGD